MKGYLLPCRRLRLSFPLRSSCLLGLHTFVRASVHTHAYVGCVPSFVLPPPPRPSSSWQLLPLPRASSVPPPPPTHVWMCGRHYVHTHLGAHTHIPIYNLIHISRHMPGHMSHISVHIFTHMSTHMSAHVSLHMQVLPPIESYPALVHKVCKLLLAKLRMRKACMYRRV